MLTACDPLAALGSLAREWRRELGAAVVAITGSTGKTTTKDILAAICARTRTTVASAEQPQHRDRTAAGDPRGSRRHGGARPRARDARSGPDRRADGDQRAGRRRDRQRRAGAPRAARIARGDRRREGGAGRRPGTRRARSPSRPTSRCSSRTCATDLRTIRFGPGGDVALVEAGPGGRRRGLGGERTTLEPGFRAPHLLADLCAAIAAARALGLTVEGPLEVSFSALRGERIDAAGRGGRRQ